MTPFLQRVIVIALIVFGVWIAAFFGLQTMHAYREVREHRPPPPFKTEQPETDVALIEDWMTRSPGCPRRFTAWRSRRA